MDRTTKKARLAAADEALRVMRDGYYIYRKTEVPVGEGDTSYCRAEHVTHAEPANIRIAQMRTYTITSIDAFRALGLAEDPRKTAVLCFADAVNPGGAFRTGGKGQEESLCRTSTLYGALTSDDALSYYEQNRAREGQLPAPTFLYSPEVYVFRKNDLTYRSYPRCTQVVSAAAPDLNAIEGPISASAVREYFLQMIRMLCSFLSVRAHDVIFGAWGCGAASNDPGMVASCFARVLIGEGMGSLFGNVIFAIPDPMNYDAFYNTFAASKATLYVTELKNRKKPPQRRTRTKTMKSEYTKGDTAYIVEQTAAKQKDGTFWRKAEVKVHSAGAKYVTVKRDGKQVRFLSSTKPVLLSEKPKAYLVNSEEHADILLQNITGSGSGGGSSEEL